jgi:PAS domain S-box-containing protein
MALIVAVGLTALLSLSALAFPPALGASMVPTSGGSQRLTWVMPGGYAYEAGLRPGDVIRFVSPPAGSAAWGAAEWVEGPRAGQIAPFQRRWPAIVDIYLFLLGLEFLLAGVVVLLKATDRPAATRFTVLATACAATFVSFPAIGNGQPWGLALEWFGSKPAMAAFALFFMTVPVDRWKRAQRVLILLPVPILALYSLTVFGHPDLYATVKPIGYSYMAFGLAVSLAAMLLPFLTHTDTARRRLWPVVAGSGLAAAIYLITGLLPYLLFRRYLIPAEVAIGGLILLPMGFVWAMLRHPIMGMSLGPWALVKTVFDTISDPIFVFGRDGQMVDASRAGLKMLGIGRAGRGEEHFGRLVAPVADLEDGGGPRWECIVDRVLAGELIRDEEWALSLPSGKDAFMSVAGTPLLSERGEVEMAVLTLHDVTERRELERQKDEFLANITHDLKTPLTAIKSSVGVVLANEPAGMSGPLHRMLCNIDVASDRMSSLVEDLLELARLRAGRAELKLDRCSLDELAKRSAATIAPLAAASGQRLEMELPAEPVPVVADGSRLERALTNLLSNAYKHGRPGGTIRLSLKTRSGEALFAVEDDGPGIPETEQSRIFDRFYRIENGSTGGGSGLGLPIARAMVEMHGGRAWVESMPGAGATFWISIPINNSVPTETRELADANTHS